MFKEKFYFSINNYVFMMENSMEISIKILIYIYKSQLKLVIKWN